MVNFTAVIRGFFISKLHFVYCVVDFYFHPIQSTYSRHAVSYYYKEHNWDRNVSVTLPVPWVTYLRLTWPAHTGWLDADRPAARWL